MLGRLLQNNSNTAATIKAAIKRVLIVNSSTKMIGILNVSDQSESSKAVTIVSITKLGTDYLRVAAAEE